ncbi:MAG: hypothetical protein AAGF54_09865 [Pseudomonadota bacterium]
MKKTLLTIALSLPLSVSAYASELASGEQLSKAISGNTVQGGMTDTGAYTEYYAADGVVHGPDYKAKWLIEDDKMCWIYEGSSKDCWDAAINGDQISWIKDGKTLGTGAIFPGNPNNF